MYQDPAACHAIPPEDPQAPLLPNRHSLNPQSDHIHPLIHPPSVDTPTLTHSSLPDQASSSACTWPHSLTPQGLPRPLFTPLSTHRLICPLHSSTQLPPRVVHFEPAWSSSHRLEPQRVILRPRFERRTDSIPLLVNQTPSCRSFPILHDASPSPPSTWIAWLLPDGSLGVLASRRFSAPTAPSLSQAPQLTP